jgi:undecaprenyl diphosphate synthase
VKELRGRSAEGLTGPEESSISRGPRTVPLEPGIAVPRHLVIIPDGNRRWARQHGLSDNDGHRRGAEVLEDLLWQCRDWGIEVLTFWGFSTENWERDKNEVNYLMRLVRRFLRRNMDELVTQQVRFRHLGRRDRIPHTVRKAIELVEDRTQAFSEYCLCLCLDYGGRDEIVRAMRRILEKAIAPSLLDEGMVGSFLDTVGLPDPDLILRTSGEHRLSGILPYQGVYSELAFVDEYFPELTAERLRGVLRDYSARTRRFGR